MKRPKRVWLKEELHGRHWEPFDLYFDNQTLAEQDAEEWRRATKRKVRVSAYVRVAAPEKETPEP